MKKLMAFGAAGIFAVASGIALANDLENNSINIDVDGDTIVMTTPSGSLEIARGLGEGTLGGHVVVSGVRIDCHVTGSCGNNNNINIDVNGDTIVRGTDATVNGVHMSSH